MRRAIVLCLTLAAAALAGLHTSQPAQAEPDAVCACLSLCGPCYVNGVEVKPAECDVDCQEP